jgi:quinol monooxygenase YgiN
VSNGIGRRHARLPPRRLAFVERWASRESLDAHLASPHVQEVLARVEVLFGDSGEIVVYELLTGGDTKKGSIAAHAAG